MLPKVLHIYCGGAYEPFIYGVATWGVIVINPATKKVIHKASGLVFPQCNHPDEISKFVAVVAALKWLLRESVENTSVVLKTDNEEVVEYLHEVFEQNEGLNFVDKKLKRLVYKVKRKGNRIKIEWIPAEENLPANILAEVIYDIYVREENPPVYGGDLN